MLTCIRNIQFLVISDINNFANSSLNATLCTNAIFSFYKNKSWIGKRFIFTFMSFLIENNANERFYEQNYLRKTLITFLRKNKSR